MTKTQLLLVLALTMCLFGMVARADMVPFGLTASGYFLERQGNYWVSAGQNLNGILVPLAYQAPASAIHDTTDPSGSLNLTLGTFSLGSVDGAVDWVEDPYYNVKFILSLSFSSPTVATRQIWAELYGEYRPDNPYLPGVDIPESIKLDFDNTPIPITYGGGSFALTIDDLEVWEGVGSAALNGHITNATDVRAVVPEPGSVLLLGTVLIALPFFLRRRG